MIQVIYLESSELIELIGLIDTSGPADVYVNDADCTLRVLDASGAEVAGENWPITMSYVAGSNGDYQATIGHTVQLIEGQEYAAKIVADSGSVRLTKKTPMKAIWSE